MAVRNSTLDNSEKRKVLAASAAATATGVTGVVAHVPFPCILVAAQAAAFGLSGSPQLALVANRFIVGTGSTAITIATGTSNTLQAFGTSGVVSTGMVIGSTQVLLPDDVVMFLTSVSSTAVTGLTVNLVVEPIQDIKKYFNGLG